MVIPLTSSLVLLDEFLQFGLAGPWELGHLNGREENKYECHVDEKYMKIKSVTFSPFLMKTKVGMQEIPYSEVTSSFSSTSTFRKMTSLYWPAISSSLGAIILQGPHHVA